ncbi:VanZ family protein [Hydrogenophaga sp.]|jgi:VanZ family protein|uniref:VanZ family protein n=1 Tax=Hydrogenophaga sp. TaxID=1904254 RepID=UPI003F6F3F6B
MIRALFWLSVIGIGIASLVPVAMLPPQPFNIWDKAQHTLAFAWLAVLGLLSYPKHAPRVALGLLLFGGVIELAQAATGWRYGEWADLAADGVGIGLGAAVWLLLSRHRAIRA